MHWIYPILSGEKKGVLAPVLRGILWLASKPYGSIVAARNWAYDRGLKEAVKVPIPVVSVGNLTVGGTGKTPAVAMIARWFREHQTRVSILSRGYGANPGDQNDEAIELETILPDVPHLQNADRVEAANTAYQELESELAILDDGFQHRRIARDLNIVLVDATEPFGYGFLLPRGLLRESLRSLRRADVVLVTRCNLVSSQRLAEIRSKVQRYAPTAAWVETEHQPVRLRAIDGSVRSLEELNNSAVVAFCGIGNPTGFFETLQQLNSHLVATRAFPDHHPFPMESIQAIRQTMKDCATRPTMMVCTGKDIAKIGVTELDSVPVFALDIELSVIAGWEAFEDRLKSILAKVHQAASHQAI